MRARLICVIWTHMRDMDARIAGFCTDFQRGRAGRGPGPPKSLKKLKIPVFRGFGVSALSALLALLDPIGPYWTLLCGLNNTVYRRE